MNPALLLWAACLAVQEPEPPPLAVDVTHSGYDCEHQQKGWACPEEGHFHIWVNGKEYPDLEKFSARLSELSAGRASLTQKVLLLPNLKTPYERVWPVLAACRKANCARLVWWEGKPPAADAATRDPAVAAKAPLDVLIKIDRERLKGTETQVEDGPWTKKDDAVLAALNKLGATARTRILIDPGGDVPWSDVAHLDELCRGKGFTRIEFLGLPAFPSASPKDITEEEARKIGELLDQASAQEQPTLFDRLIDRQEMHRRLTGDTALSGRIRHLLSTMFEINAPSSRMLRKSAEGQKPLRFLKTSIINGQARPLMRFLPANGLDYLEIVLARDENGEPRIADVHNLSQGMTATQSYRSFTLSDAEKVSVLNKLQAPMPGDLAHFTDRQVDKLVGLATENRSEEAIQHFRDNVETFRKSEYALKVYVNISRKVDPDHFLSAVTEYAKHFPDSSALYLLRMEALLVKGDRENALEAIQVLDRRVGGDPYLELLRARAHLAVKDGAQAKACALRAAEREPGLALAWWTLVGLAVEQKDFKGLAEALSGVEEKLKQPLGELDAIPEFAEFLKSDEYRKWAASRKK